MCLRITRKPSEETHADIWDSRQGQRKPHKLAIADFVWINSTSIFRHGGKEGKDEDPPQLGLHLYTLAEK